jgi:hypothetical protein
MHGFWKSWMIGWCYATIAFGLAFCLAAFPATEGPARLYYDIVYWPFDGASAFGAETRFTAAVLGAVLLGWAVAILGLVDVAPEAPAAWRWLTASMLLWYVVDSILSVATGVPGNAVSNSFFLAGFLAPVLGSGVLRPAGRTSTG